MSDLHAAVQRLIRSVICFRPPRQWFPVFRHFSVVAGPLGIASPVILLEIGLQFRWSASGRKVEDASKVVDLACLLLERVCRGRDNVEDAEGERTTSDKRAV